MPGYPPAGKIEPANSPNFFQDELAAASQIELATSLLAPSWRIRRRRHFSRTKISAAKQHRLLPPREWPAQCSSTSLVSAGHFHLCTAEMLLRGLGRRRGEFRVWRLYVSRCRASTQWTRLRATYWTRPGPRYGTPGGST